MSTTSTYLRCLDVRENEATKVHVSNIYMYRNRKVIEIECGGDCVRVCGIPGCTPERGYRRDPYTPPHQKEVEQGKSARVSEQENKKGRERGKT